MAISMYEASIPVFIRMLTNCDQVLDKALAHAEAKKIDPGVFVQMRLYPDMLPLARQVQIASDMAKGCAARLAGQEPAKYEDTETTFPELKARLAKTIAFLRTFRPDQIDGTEERSIVLTFGPKTLTFQGLPYLLYFVLPNFYFHLTTAYAILRHGASRSGRWISSGHRRGQAGAPASRHALGFGAAAHLQPRVINIPASLPYGSGGFRGLSSSTPQWSALGARFRLIFELENTPYLPSLVPARLRFLYVARR